VSLFPVSDSLRSIFTLFAISLIGTSNSKHWIILPLVKSSNFARLFFWFLSFLALFLPLYHLGPGFGSTPTRGGEVPPRLRLRLRSLTCTRSLISLVM